MWVHPINIKRAEFGIFGYFYPDLLEDEEKFHLFFFLERISVCSTVYHSLWESKYENETPTT